MTAIPIPEVECAKCKRLARVDVNFIMPPRDGIHGGLRVQDSDGATWVVSGSFPAGWAELPVGSPIEGALCGTCLAEFKDFIAPDPVVVEPEQPITTQRTELFRPAVKVEPIIQSAAQQGHVQNVVHATSRSPIKTSVNQIAEVVRPGGARTSAIPSSSNTGVRGVQGLPSAPVSSRPNVNPIPAQLPEATKK